MRGLCKQLTTYSRNTVHLLTPFDSGGSSASLRKAFEMPAVGDTRNRLLALADLSKEGTRAIYSLLEYRLPEDLPRKNSMQILLALCSGIHPLMQAVPKRSQRVLRQHLSFLISAMPDSFELGGASIGNLILAGGYLNDQRRMEPVLFLLSRLLNVQGSVKPVCDANCHLVAHLPGGQKIIGQHVFTGKEQAPTEKQILALTLSTSYEKDIPCTAVISHDTSVKIKEADLIVYPPGSFYSSLIANLLPSGVAEAIANNPKPKVYVPNLGEDPEQFGMTLVDCLRKIVSVLNAQQAAPLSAQHFVDHVLLDSAHLEALGQAHVTPLESLGLEVVARPLVSTESAPYYDNKLLTKALLSLSISQA